MENSKKKIYTKIMLIMVFTVILVFLINIVVQSSTGKSLIELIFQQKKNSSDIEPCGTPIPSNSLIPRETVLNEISDDVFMDYKYIVDYSPLSVDESSESEKYYIDFKRKEVTKYWSDGWLDDIDSGSDKKIIDDSVSNKLMRLLKEIDDERNYRGLDHIETNEENKEKLYCFEYDNNELFAELKNVFK